MDISRPVANAGEAADIRFGGGGDYVYLCASEAFLGSESPKSVLLVAGTGSEAKSVCTNAGSGYKVVGPNLHANQQSAEYSVSFCSRGCGICYTRLTSGSCPSSTPKKLSVNIADSKPVYVCVQE